MNRRALAAFFVASVAACAPKEGTAPADPPAGGFLPPGVVPFEAGMKRPEPAIAPPLEDMPDLVPLSPEALAKTTRGFRAQCILTAEGKVTACLFRSTSGSQSEAALAALTKQTFKPAEKNGLPVAVEYEFGWALREERDLAQRPFSPPPPPVSPAGTTPFGKGMTRPQQVSGPPIRHTPEALAEGVEGMMIVRCVITEAGTVEGCHVIKGLPHLDQAVLRGLEASKYTPVEFNGRPVRVNYTFTLRFALPRK
ncbi:energy transducer TonB [Polyangium sp. 6x1]|uniref:energy transducer TonB n=1 Tax=Polyangium sp. 6x1 TaxID=3042689 RepID=UPI002483191F|nr:energy transducer TonB [Polyangium sp. 6x1]MDI1451625.1 energy transducer TonB [Polyangium sp. 6x1]